MVAVGDMAVFEEGFGIRPRTSELRAVDPQKTAFVLWTTVDALFTQKVYRYEELLPIYTGIVRDGLRSREGFRSHDRRSRNSVKGAEKR